MTNEQMAESALRLAGQVLGEGQRHRDNGAWSLSVRRAQEVVELALKGMLRFLGIEVPKVHDVSGYLRRYKDRLPPPLADDLDRIARISRRLREEREISFYGDEKAGFGPEELYSADDAEEALSDATFIYDLCERIIRRNRPR